MHRNKIIPLLLSCTAFFLAVSPSAEETAVVTEGKVNVRGKPSLVGEVITQLERGDKVTVLERITAEKSKENEPTNWAKIKLPQNTPVWVFAPFVKDGKVAATRLNLRAGPGENHDVIGRLNRGDEVKAIRTIEEWTEIEAPKDAYAFIDLTLVKFDGATNAPAPTIAATPQPQQPEKTEPQPAPVTTTTPAPTPETNAVAAATTETPATPAAVRLAEPVASEARSPADTAPATTSAATNLATTVPEIPRTTPQTTPQPLPKVAPPVPSRRNEPLPKRVVRREGVIRATKSIQAPTWYELVNADSGKTINYLYDEKMREKLGLNLKDYRGKKVVVTGEEAIDSRWPNTPILDLETMDVLP
jgi:hypothetical protein